MSISTTEQRHGNRIHVAPVVDYSAVDRPAHARQVHTSAPAGNQPAGVPVGLIREGCAVLCRDGKAGRVAQVVTHPEQGYPTQLIVRYGWLRPRHVRVPVTAVTGVAPDYLELNLSRQDLGRQPEYRHDDEIAEAIDQAFHGVAAPHDYGDYLAIRVTVADGIVTLHGNVRDASRRLAAEQVVSRIRGVIAVRSCLFEDDAIEGRASAALLHDPRLSPRNLRVESCLGLVRLHGQIASASQRALATALVNQVPGVQAVINGLRVAATLERPTVAARPSSWQRVGTRRGRRGTGQSRRAWERRAGASAPLATPGGSR